jgi:hypothetical protein
MAEGVDEAQWWHTAAIRSTIYACVGIKKTPAALHPFEIERHRPRTPEQLARAEEARAIVAQAMNDAMIKRGVRHGRG